MSQLGNTMTKRDAQEKFAQSRVSTVEKYYGLLCHTLGSVIRKSARLRDKGDLFAHYLKEYTEKETLNNSTKVNLSAFAQNFSAVQDYRDAEVKRLEEKVLKPIMNYGTICKNMKSSVKGNQAAAKKESKQMEKVAKLEQKLPRNDAEISKAYNDLQRIRQESGSYREQLMTEIDVFESRKINDLKSVLSEYVKIEMMFHARALKYLSECYQSVQRIDTEADIDSFRAELVKVSGMAQPFTQTLTSMSSPNQTSSSGAGATNLFQSQYVPRRSGITGNMYDTQDSDDEEEEEDEEDETSDES
ncbi:CBY1-interacting BAR domain-containing protein 1-A-like [Physella acuta]|uniref:CBY1-interacting BAR domain-containing protein 1-A-like n=1 Tax=Physella acuta TaxID=109671 RepID=UPI0027DE68B6|nr:CBY1-interacting BAR domain-containing protein 1-A-like [Physella acuta]